MDVQSLLVSVMNSAVSHEKVLADQPACPWRGCVPPRGGTPHLLVSAIGKLCGVPFSFRPKGSLDSLHQHGFLSIPASTKNPHAQGSFHQMSQVRP